MCTCFNFKTKDNYFGRNMDMEHNFGEKVVITPKNYKFDLKNGTTFNTKYAMIGIAAVVKDYPLYAEACNEVGLSMAGLEFPNNAYFFEPNYEKQNLAPYELIPYFLGNFSKVSEIKKIIKNLNITNIPFSEGIPITDLHWMVSDGDECIVMEPGEDEIKVYDNPIGVMTNNPPFIYQLTNINNYMNLVASPAENRFSSKIDLQPYGLGMGAIGLPGDNSPSSRFIRATFNKFNSLVNDDEESSVTQFFHILDSVLVIRGTTIRENGKCHVTTYSSCINTTKGIYYYKTYTNNQITAIHMKNYKEKNRLTIFDLINNQQIRYIY